MWVVRDSITSPEKIDNLVAAAKLHGFNTLFVQVRGRGDAYYNSRLEPRAEELAGQPLSFDPLETIIERAHAAGIQVHAWANMCYVWSAGRPPVDPSHMVNAHPEWLARDAGGGFQLCGDSNCEGAFMAPSNAQARRHLHDVIMDIVSNYDVDGIHFDYIRYPNSDYDRSVDAESQFAGTIRPTLDPPRRKALDALGAGAYVRAFPSWWADWRRDQITSLVEWISRDVKSAKPWVCVSAAVFANYDDADNARGQDWKRWLRDGALDAVIPMAYASSTAEVDAQIRDAAQTARLYGRACYAGLGSWRISADSTVAKIQAARADGARGIVLFSYGGITDDGANLSYLNDVARAAFPINAAIPQLTSLSSRPAAPIGLDTTQ
jgi:uncharacterized lipoprotein YddW (UPF0748 family)